MARLWKVFHGEPFMVNPHLGILGLNPKRKKGKASSMAKSHRSKSHMSWVRSFRKNAHRRKGGRRHAMAHNPRRRKSYRRNPVHNARRRSYRRNPGLGLGGFFSLPPLQSVIYGGVGFAGTPFLEGFLVPYLPTAITGNTVGKYATRIAVVLGLTFLAKSLLGREPAKMVGVGGGMYVAVSAVREFAPDVAKRIGLAGYTAYPGLNAYTSAGPVVQLAAYTSQKTGLNGGGGSFVGSTQAVASRFRRFQ
jgi:hypothetical protein